MYFCRLIYIIDMENLDYTESTTTTTLPRKRRTKTVKRTVPVKQAIPEGYMSLQQFEKELVEAVAERL